MALGKGASLPSARTAGTRQRILKKIKKKPSLPSARPGGTRQRILKNFKKIKNTLPSARSGALGKDFFLKKKPLCRVPGQVALSKELKKLKKTLPSARSGATSREMTFHPLRFWALVSVFFASGSKGRISPGWS